MRSIYGRVAERLGRGLQNLVRRFESAPDLHIFERTTDFEPFTTLQFQLAVVFKEFI